jgi:hypothetical protein
MSSDPVPEGHRSSTPEVLKPSRGELGVAHGRLNAAMAEIGLQRACVRALVRQGKASAVPQHVRVDLERQLGLYACPFDQLGKSRGRERCLPLGHEYKGRRGLALERPQSPQLIARERVRRGLAALRPAQMQIAGFELNIGPLQAAKLTGAQAMPESHQDHGTIAQAPAIALGGSDELVHLALGQMLARPQLCIGSPNGLDCPIFCCWRDQLET